MKLKKDWTLVQVTLRENGKAFYGIAGYDRHLFQDLPEDSRILSVNESRREIAITDKNTFELIKKSKVIHENLFPYEKTFDELEVFE